MFFLNRTRLQILSASGCTGMATCMIWLASVKGEYQLMFVVATTISSIHPRLFFLKTNMRQISRVSAIISYLFNKNISSLFNFLNSQEL